MLVLTREVGQIIDIEPGIELVVVSIDGNKVRIGVHAPESVPVHRREVYEAIKRDGSKKPARIALANILAEAKQL